MSVSNWFTPLTITQNLNEDSHLIPWKTPLAFPLLSTRDFIHIAGTGGPGPNMTDVRYKSTALTLTNFEITCDPILTITGVELKLDIERNGRISDSEINLRDPDGNLSINKTSYSVDDRNHLLTFNHNLYGDEYDTWGLDLTSTMLQDSNFGVNIRVQSHPFYPHKCGVMIRQVALRYYFA